jgi:hypothetical protein
LLTLITYPRLDGHHGFARAMEGDTETLRRFSQPFAVGVAGPDSALKARPKAMRVQDAERPGGVVGPVLDAVGELFACLTRGIHGVQVSAVAERAVAVGALQVLEPAGG